MDPWLLVAGDFTPLGGMDRANHALAAGLARRGAEVHLVTHRVWADLAQPNVHHRIVPRPFGSHLAGAPLLAAAARTARERSTAGRMVANGGNAISADATWIHYVHAAYVPTVASVAGRVRDAAATRYYRRRERLAIDAAKYIVCNSRRTADDVARAYDVRPERLRVVYYGSDPNAFGPVDERQRASARHELGWRASACIALFVGALGDRRKGFDRLFEAWTLLSRDPSWEMELAVAGQGRELETWRARADREGLRGIRFLGFRPDVAQIIAASDVMVHPARYEAYGLGVHESICRGVPAIVSASAGVTERVSGPLRELLLQEPESAAEIAGKLEAWRANRERFADAAGVVGEQLRRHTWDDMAGEFVRAVAG